jgi:hypothetical protein
MKKALSKLLLFSLSALGTAIQEWMETVYFSLASELLKHVVS